jgi:hypothetical protein
MHDAIAAVRELSLDAVIALASQLDLATLGVAYLVLLLNVLVTAVCFALSRNYLVVSPNPAARDYGLYVAAVLVGLLTMTVLENELQPLGPRTLPYAAVPQLVILLVIHMAIYCRQEPWLVALGATSIVGALPVIALFGLVTGGARAAHWITLGLGASLVIFLWRKAVSTKRSFLKAHSLNTPTKELRRLELKQQKAWLGLTQWVALVLASALLAALNEVLRGIELAQIPVVGVLVQVTAILCVTALVSAIPATTYWLTRKAWLPELTRLVWLVWLVVGFAFTYGNVLTSLQVT